MDSPELKAQADKVAANISGDLLQKYAREKTLRRVAEKRVEELRHGYIQCLEDMECWAAYADSYFQQKHDLAGDVKRHREILGLSEVEGND